MARTMTLVKAAGGVVWRGKGRDLRIAVVHRPRYDDWTLPKGKLEVDESFEDAAVREVFEETGLVVRVGAALPSVRYTDHKGRPKVVRYWSMNVVGGAFAPNDEVDALRWCRPRKAAELLSYGRDLEVLEAFLADAG